MSNVVVLPVTRRMPSAEPSMPVPRQLEDMVWIAGGTFTMGSDDHYAEEAPAHEVRVDGFWIDRTTVTNKEFLRFVEETGYLTLAERTPLETDYPGAESHLLVAGSVVFQKARKGVDLGDCHNWWAYVPGANWRHPEGPKSSLKGRFAHPVVHVAYEDVEAYASWAGKSMPTEAEWEFAARGGLEGAEYAWEGELHPNGRMMANTWQGQFPWQNLRTDGFERTSPVGSFPPNGYGLSDMIGNVWEWTCDWYQEHGKVEKTCCTLDNPRGGSRDTSVNPRSASAGIPRKVTKGGSFLCAPNYCRRYRPAARMAQEIDTSTCHLGMRLVVRSHDR